MKRVAQDSQPYFHRLEFRNLTLLLRTNVYNAPEDAPESPCILAAFKDQKWFAISERTSIQERYHLENLSETDMIYIESGHLRLTDPNKSQMVEEFKKRNDPAKEFTFFIPSKQDEVPITRSVFFKRQTYEKLITSPLDTSSIELVNIDAKEEMTVDLFHRHEHRSTREDDYNRTVFASTRLRFVQCMF